MPSEPVIRYVNAELDEVCGPAQDPYLVPNPDGLLCAYADLERVTRERDELRALLCALRVEWQAVVDDCTVDLAEQRTPEYRQQWEENRAKLVAEFPDEEHDTWEEYSTCVPCKERRSWIARVDSVMPEAPNDK